jgi:hypothetical protein
VNRKQRFPDVNALFRRKRASEIRSRYSDGVHRWTENHLAVRLPASYIALLKQRNGGRLRMNAVKVPKRAEMYRFERIAGLDRHHEESLTSLSDLARSGEVPERLIPIDGDGHWWLCLDYRRCRPDGEPVVTHYEIESSRRGKDHDEFRVADSFAALLEGLVFDAGDFVFAIDDPALPGEPLHKMLVAAGCRGKYPPDASRQERKKVPRMWSWPAFKAGPRESASLFVYENDLPDPWSPARPAQHPLLLLDVGRKDQERCVHQLIDTLGPAVPLIHQPLDRPPIRNLSEAAPFKAPKTSRAAAKTVPKLDPKGLNAAVLAGDRKLVKALLESGAEPDKRYFGPGTATALDCAVMHGLTPIVKLLLPYVRKPLDQQLLRSALHNGYKPMVRLLGEHGLTSDGEK